MHGRTGTYSGTFASGATVPPGPTVAPLEGRGNGASTDSALVVALASPVLLWLQVVPVPRCPPVHPAIGHGIAATQQPALERAHRIAAQRPAGTTADDTGAGVAHPEVAAVRVSSLGPRDDDLHYEDNSHRWIAPPGIRQEAWETLIATHLEQHRRQLGHGTPGGRSPRPESAR